MNSDETKKRELKPRCPACDRPLSWLTRHFRGRYCSAECKTRYVNEMTRLAVERLHVTLPRTLPPSQQDRRELASGEVPLPARSQ